MTDLRIEHLDLDSLVSFERNPRTISPERLASLKASVRSLGLFKPLLIWRDLDGRPLVIGGNQRLRALREMRSEGDEVGPVPVVEFDGDEPTARTIAIRDNTSDGEWDLEALAEYVSDLDSLAREFESEFDLVALSGLDEKTMESLSALAGDGDGDGEGEGDGVDDTYTHKIQSPVYEPTSEEPPPISSLFDSTKTADLVAEIERSDIPEDVAEFLRFAAERHTAFHFGRIAEFYAHASPEVQRLMERSGLVIVDFEAAIEHGFVRLTERLARLADIEQQTPDGDESADA